jgi:plastocyanin
MKLFILGALGLPALFAALPAFADAGTEVYEISIKDHAFTPEEISVPAGKKIKLKVNNLDPTPEEFESHELNREKIIAGKSSATIFIGPLEPGKYHYFGEFHMDTANGYIVAK